MNEMIAPMIESQGNTVQIALFFNAIRDVLLSTLLSFNTSSIKKQPTMSCGKELNNRYQ